MKNSYRVNNDYYHNSSREFNASTRSMAKRRHHLSSSKVSETKSRFEHRIEKACPTKSTEAYKKQVMLLKKQLERLEKDNLKKDHRIFQMESNHSMFRQLQSQLQETYRIIYMYEGKIQQLQRQLKRLQHKVADKLESIFTAEQIQGLLNEYQDDNAQMRSTIQGQNRIIMELEERLRTIQSKYFQTSWKLSSQNRVLANPLKKKFPKLRDTIVIQEVSLAQREKMMNDLENKFYGFTAYDFLLSRQKAKDNTNMKSSVFSSRQKLSVNNSQNQQLKNQRFSGTWETPASPRISKTLHSQQDQSVSSNYTVQKVQTSPKVFEKNYRQEWQANKQANNVTYETYKKNENRKSKFSSEQGQSVSLNYSSSQIPTMIQRSFSPQNGIVTTYRVSSSFQGDNIVSQSSKGENQTRMLNPQTIYRSVQTNSSSRNTYENAQRPQSPSTRIVRVSREKQENSYSQSNQSIKTSYYQGTSIGSRGSEETTDQKVRYVMRQAS